jgi:hypothetical protein
VTADCPQRVMAILADLFDGPELGAAA